MYDNFGFKKVSYDEKKKLVQDVFSKVASKYDLMNDLMSFGLHRLWKRKLCDLITNMNSKIIDVASGTGDIAILLSKKARNHGKTVNITLCDINNDMLNLAKDKLYDENLFYNTSFVTADATNLPFPDNVFDYYVISFGIRNISPIEKCLQEANRVLKLGGKFLCLEFSKFEIEELKSVYDWYRFNVIPAIGQYVVDAKDAYEYLAQSIEVFKDQEEMRCLIYEAGFYNPTYINLSGGIAAIFSGSKVNTK